MGLIISGVSASDLILDGKSVSLYVGGNPPTKVWPTRETVQITLGTGTEARDQFRAALTDRGLTYQTVTEIPFDIELVGSGSAQYMLSGCSSLATVPDMDTSGVTSMSGMFNGCPSLTYVPDMDTSSVTNMNSIFWNCSSLTSVPALDTSQVTDMSYMFYGCSSLTTVPSMDTSQVIHMSGMFDSCSSLTYVPHMNTSQVRYMYGMFQGCSSLTDGNVRLIGMHPDVYASYMIDGSGLTREPFYSAGGQPLWVPQVHEVYLTDVRGSSTIHPLLTVTVPAGETWSVRIQGTVTKASSTTSSQPQVRIGAATFGPYAQNAAVDASGTVTSANATIALVTRSNTTSRSVSFFGSVTIKK